MSPRQCWRRPRPVYACRARRGPAGGRRRSCPSRSSTLYEPWPPPRVPSATRGTVAVVCTSADELALAEALHGAGVRFAPARTAGRACRLRARRNGEGPRVRRGDRGRAGVDRVGHRVRHAGVVRRPHPCHQAGRDRAPRPAPRSAVSRPKRPRGRARGLYSPVVPSIISRSRSACPLWRAYSFSVFTSQKRIGRPQWPVSSSDAVAVTTAAAARDLVVPRRSASLGAAVEADSNSLPGSSPKGSSPNEIQARPRPRTRHGSRCARPR